jgi:hypothetical protein
MVCDWERSVSGGELRVWIELRCRREAELVVAHRSHGLLSTPSLPQLSAAGFSKNMAVRS